MLLVTFHNDGTGSEVWGNYNVVVYLNQKTLWTGRIEGHHRAEGWQELVNRLVRKPEIYEE